MTDAGDRAVRMVNMTLLLLLEPDRHTRKALAARYGVSERQITKDLAVLDAGLDTAIHHSRRGYRFDAAFVARVRAAVDADSDGRLNAEEAAQIAGVTPEAIGHAAKIGRLRAEKSTHHAHAWRIRREDLDAYLASRQRGRRALPDAQRARIRSDPRAASLVAAAEGVSVATVYALRRGARPPAPDA